MNDNQHSYDGQSEDFEMNHHSTSPLSIESPKNNYYQIYQEQELKTNFWESGAMGLNPFRKRHNIEAPQGFRVGHTKNGQPYLLKGDIEPHELSSIINEHSRTKLGLFCSWDDIEEEYGLGGIFLIFFTTNFS